MPKPKKNKKVGAKRAKQKQVEAAPIDKIQQDYQNNLKSIKLINLIRKTKDEKLADNAFEELLSMLIPKINKVVSKFRIPGNDTNDVMQEALYALRYKAIKDYDKSRGNGEGPAPFDKFATLCIRRHLATEFKSSYQNKKRVLNQSISINKEAPLNGKSRNGGNEEVSLASILSDPKMKTKDVGEQVAENEYYDDLKSLLMQSLSSFEKEVFLLYSQKYSYEEISEMINSKRMKVRVNVKGVDNALSRIKHKAKEIRIKYEKKQKE